MNRTPYAMLVTMLTVVILAVACDSVTPNRSGPAAQVGVEVIPTDAQPVQDVQPEELRAEPPAEMPTQGSVREIAVTAKKYTFSPNPITVKQGERVRVNVAVPMGDTDHGFALPDFGVNLQISPGETKTAEFTADKVGTFEIFCSVYCGSGHSGMKGQLIVEP